VAHAVHVLTIVPVLAIVLLASCVVPPPLEVDTSDGGVNAPPTIVNVIDTSGTSRRPPDTITLLTTPQEIIVNLVERDVEDELFLQLFVDYQLMVHDADVNCTAPPTADRSSTRSTSCVTTSLCDTAPSEHTLEIEVYDREPEPNAPYRDTEGFFATWTFHLVCQ
jgi:hypothetical protein